MKSKSFLAVSAGLALGLLTVPLAPVATAQVVEEVQKTTTTTYTGTVTEIVPSTSTIVVKSETAPEPARYIYTKKTTFVDDAGNVVTEETVRGKPVTIHYTKEGDSMVVTRVVVSKPGVIRKETTTETKEIH